MQYIERKHNVERVFEVSWDVDALNILLNEIVKNCSYHIISNLGEKSKKEISTLEQENDYIKMPNGESMYQFIKNPDGSYSKIKTVSPELPYILFEILNNREGSIYKLYDYINHSDFEGLDEKINKLQHEIENVDKHQTDKKRQLLTNLQVLYILKKEHYYFNLDALKEYYSNVFDYIDLSLISEKRIFNGDEEYRFANSEGKLRLRRKQKVSKR